MTDPNREWSESWHWTPAAPARRRENEAMAELREALDAFEEIPAQVKTATLDVAIAVRALQAAARRVLEESEHGR